MLGKLENSNGLPCWAGKSFCGFGACSAHELAGRGMNSANKRDLATPYI